MCMCLNLYLSKWIISPSSSSLSLARQWWWYIVSFFEGFERFIYSYNNSNNNKNWLFSNNNNYYHDHKSIAAFIIDIDWSNYLLYIKLFIIIKLDRQSCMCCSDYCLFICSIYRKGKEEFIWHNRQIYYYYYY